LRLGDINEAVFVVQVSLNRIAQNYPAIPKIWPVTGIYDEKTQQAVREFQRIFNLTPDGIVGKATWYRLVYLYVGVTRLGELVSQGQAFGRVGFQYPGLLREGSSGEGVRTLQYMLAVLAEFNSILAPVGVDGAFGPATTRAVQAFQRSVGLPADGLVGEQTWDALYRNYIGIGNYLERDRVRFPDPALSAGSGQRDGGFGRTPRLGQFPGYSMSLGQADRRGEVMV